MLKSSFAVLVILTLVCVSTGWGGMSQWTGADASNNFWTNPNNWDVGVPGSGDITVVTLAPDPNRFPEITDGMNAVSSKLYIFAPDNPPDPCAPVVEAVVDMNGGSLILGDSIQLGRYDYNPPRNFLDQPGKFNMSGGSIDTAGLYCGSDSNGTFNFSGGDIFFSYGVRVGSDHGDGVFNMSGGTIGGWNNFSIGYCAYPDSSATLNLSGGTIDMNYPCEGGPCSWQVIVADGTDGVSTFNMTGGTLNIANERLYLSKHDSSYGVMNMTDGDVNTLGVWWGYYLSPCGGTLNMQGGQIHCRWDLDMTGGTGQKVLNLSGGTISCERLTVDKNDPCDYPYSGQKDGFIDICGGTLELYGRADQEAVDATIWQLTNNANDGLIVPYGGHPRANLVFDQQGTPGDYTVVVTAAFGPFDFEDFASLAEYWQETDCGLCGYNDFDEDNDVDIYDLKFLTERWLTP